MNNNMARRRLLREIKETEFVLKELNLFLDTHPDHREALEKFQKFEQMSKKLKSEYERMFGPLTPSVNNNTETWEWIQGPWPWENR
ncbi:MAG: spore coat protein CotJB [Clostridia bacterium]|nr:spore coat protein CotJB [Clostridia bacterium]